MTRKVRKSKLRKSRKSNIKYRKYKHKRVKGGAPVVASLLAPMALSMGKSVAKSLLTKDNIAAAAKMATGAASQALKGADLSKVADVAKGALGNPADAMKMATNVLGKSGMPADAMKMATNVLGKSGMPADAMKMVQGALGNPGMADAMKMAGALRNPGSLASSPLVADALKNIPGLSDSLKNPIVAAALKNLPPISSDENQSKLDNMNTIMKSVGKLLNFSLSSLLISPLYIMTVIANLPLNTLNNLSGRNFDKHRTDALGVQLYKYMFEGYRKNDIEKKYKEHPELYDIDPQYKVKGELVTKCDTDDCNKTMKKDTFMKGGKSRKSKGKGKRKMKGGYVDTYKTMKELMGVLNKDEQIIHNLKSLEDTIDSLKMDFYDRKLEIKKMFKSLNDPKILFKCIVVCNTLIKDCKVGVNEVVKVNKDNVIVKNPYKTVDGKFSSHFYMNVCYLDKNCKDACNTCDIADSISCTVNRMSNTVGLSHGTDECSKKCNCNIFSNIISIYHAYVRVMLKSLGGNSNSLYFIIDLLFMTIRHYAKKDESHEPYKIYLQLEDIPSIQFLGDFSQIIKDQVAAIDLFKSIICKYGIYEIVKENFTNIVKKAKDKSPEAFQELKDSLKTICDGNQDATERVIKKVNDYLPIPSIIPKGGILDSFKKALKIT